nr:hypothetical protein GCM10020093_075050 [Planobispora longispora]
MRGGVAQRLAIVARPRQDLAAGAEDDRADRHLAAPPARTASVRANRIAGTYPGSAAAGEREEA